MRRYLRAELLLPLTIIAAAAMVAASEFMTTFEFTSAGATRAVSTASDRHSYALLILAVLTVGAMAYAIVTGRRAAAIVTAAIGCTTLLLFLTLDLPDAGKVGPLEGDPGLYFADARAEAAAGFLLEAVGTVVLGLATVAFATLSSAQLRAPAELIAARRRDRREEQPRQQDRQPGDHRATARSQRADREADGGAPPQRIRRGLRHRLSRSDG